VKAGVITPAQLNDQILKYLKPEITLAPQAPGMVFKGQQVTLQAQAEGKFLQYQWLKNGKEIKGATNDRLVIKDVKKKLHDGNYSVVVSNDFGSITTQPAQLVVDGTPTSHNVASIRYGYDLLSRLALL
jgi:membrane carboxypeptidase/penicillin-binding protein PbpC